MSSIASDEKQAVCAILIVQLSASMNAGFSTNQGKTTKARASRLLADCLIEDLLAATEDLAHPAVDLGVIGYSADSAGQAVVRSLLPDTGDAALIDSRALSRSEVASRKTQGAPRRWCQAIEPRGEACASAG
jgi:hypothetical protein